MLTHLQIRDFALIDSVELELRRGLTVLTGETGAGKSILVDALQLLAGGRAGAEVVRHGAERAEVSGTFELSQPAHELQQWLEEQSVSGAGELTVRRVVGADGRSRAYLNGQAVPVQLLREAGNILIDIHGQHEFQSLTRSAAQGAQTALAELYENQAASAHAGVSRALQALRGLAALDGKLAVVLPMLEEASIQVREAARELERYRETLDVDAARQDEVERRLA